MTYAVLKDIPLNGAAWLVIDVTYPGVCLPAQLWSLARDGQLLIQINPDIREALDRGLESFTTEVAGERFHVPGGALLGIRDENGRFHRLGPDTGAAEPEMH